MAILEILTVPDPRLKIVAESVDSVDDEVRQLVDDMLETMYAAPGIGLAATQVDIHRRIVVMDISDNHDRPLCFINPEIVSCEGSVIYEEGCLSVPGIYDGVERAESIVVKALDREGKPFTMEAEGLLAICIQHEIDHLNGKVFIDYLSSLKQQRIKKKLEKMSKR